MLEVNFCACFHYTTIRSLCSLATGSISSSLLPRKNDHFRDQLFLVAATGIEPVTLGLWVLRSNQLSYAAIIDLSCVRCNRTGFDKDDQLVRASRDYLCWRLSNWATLPRRNSLGVLASKQVWMLALLRYSSFRFRKQLKLGLQNRRQTSLPIAKVQKLL